MTSSSLVSVILPVYNGEKFIEAALLSVLTQTYKNLEILAVDDGSTDGTSAILEKYKGRIQVLKQSNEGVFRARNNAAALAQGEFLAFIDADDLWRPEKIEKQLAVFERHPEVSVVSSAVREIDGAGNVLRVNTKGMEEVLDKPKYLHRRLLMTGNLIALSTAVVRKSAFVSAGGYYVQKRILSADYDLWIRVSEGGKFVILSEPLADYRILEDSLLHGSLEKEYGAQIGIIELNRHRFSDRDFKSRMAGLHYDWADSASHQGKPGAFSHWVRAVCRRPLNVSFWPLGARIVGKKILGR